MLPSTVPPTMMSVAFIVPFHRPPRASVSEPSMSQSPSMVPQHTKAPCPEIVPTILVEDATNVGGPPVESCIRRFKLSIASLRKQAPPDAPSLSGALLSPGADLLAQWREGIPP